MPTTASEDKSSKNGAHDRGRKAETPETYESVEQLKEALKEVRQRRSKFKNKSGGLFWLHSSV